jgi:predicted acylesterase/phospholipase RssA
MERAPAANTTAQNTFDIGLVLAGGGSAGAYIAGVIDFLMEALSEWETARNTGHEAGLEVPQAHRVRLRVITGASAGAAAKVMASP